VKCFTATVDEVTTVDNGCWISITIYSIENFSRRSFTVALEHIEEGCGSHNLTKVIMKNITRITGMSQLDISKGMVSFGAGKLKPYSLHALHVVCI
jgi:hypothetical protein